MKHAIRSRRRSAAAAIVALATAALGLTACSPSPSTSTGPVTITYGLWAEEFRAPFQSAVDAFEKENPDITVKLVLTPFADYFTKLNTQISSKTAPDAFWLQNIHINLYAKNGALADLSSYVADPDTDLSGIPKSIMDPYVIDGKQFALPWQALPFGLYYNADLFAAAGVDLPTNDWTWDDVAAAAKKLTNADAGIYGIAAPIWGYGTFYQSMYGYGADVITDGGTDTDFDSPEAQKGLKVWTDLVAEGSSPSVQQTTDTPADSWFSSGKAAMITSGPWVASSYHDALGDAVKVVAMPTGDVDRSGYATTTTAVSASSAHIAEAAKFAEFLSGDEGQKILSGSGIAGGPVNANANQTWIDAIPGIGIENLLGELGNAKLLPSTNNTAVWEDQEVTTFAPAYNGQASVGEVTKTMAEITRKAIAEE